MLVQLTRKYNGCPLDPLTPDEHTETLPNSYVRVEGFLIEHHFNFMLMLAVEPPHDTLCFVVRVQLSSPYLWLQQVIPTIKNSLTYCNSVYFLLGLLAAFLQVCDIVLVDPPRAVEPHDTLRFFARAQLSAPYLWSQ